MSIYQAYRKGYLIVTDDLSFISYIKKLNIKSLSTAHLLLVLFKKGNLDRDKAFDCLERLKPIIRKEVYELIKKDIRGE